MKVAKAKAGDLSVACASVFVSIRVRYVRRDARKVQKQIHEYSVLDFIGLSINDERPQTEFPA